MEINKIIELVRQSNFVKINELVDFKKLTQNNAKDIFLFLYDYTNSFKNANTSPQIMLLAWKMLEHWIDHDKLIVEKTKKTLKEMKMCGKIIKNIEKYRNWEILWVYIPSQYIEESWKKICIQSSFLNNILITVNWAKLCFMIIENKHLNYQVLLWSKYEKNEINDKLSELWIINWWTINWKSIEEIIEIITK